MKTEREQAMTVKPSGGKLDISCSNCGKEMTFAHHMEDGRYLCHECEKTERACPECGGQEKIIIDISKGIVVDCPICNGSGKEREAGE